MGSTYGGGGEDVFIPILVRLPIVSMLRFKSVCKSWRDLIESSFFIDLHTTTSSSKFGSFILQTIDYSHEEYAYEGEIKMFMLSSSDSDGDGDGTSEDDKDEKKKKMVFDLGFLPFYKDFRLSSTLCMVGSCNGIICLYDPELMDGSKGSRKQHYSNLRDVSLWNPATRQFRILPKSIPIDKAKERWMGTRFYEDFVAFGFDIKTKDYKVLRINSFIPESYRGRGCMCRVQVYSLSTDSWRLLEGINSLPAVPNQLGLFFNYGIYVNGSYFFVGTKLDDNEIRVFMLLSFDFTKEIFTTSTMQFPENDRRHNMVLSSYLGEKMALFTLRIDCDGNEYYDIWVLNEQHGSVNGVVNEEAWTKLHSHLFRTKSRGEKPYTEPRYISNNGEFALISTGTDRGRGKYQLLNFFTKEAKKEITIGDGGNYRADVYKESLVSIMGGNVLLRWQNKLPRHGTHRPYRLNLDAPFIAYNFSFGIGLCLTSDDTGACIGVRSLRRHVRDAEEGEALAMLEAIKWAKKLELSPIIIESDSKNCLSFFMDEDDDCNLTNWSPEALSSLWEAKHRLNSSELDISFQYCSRRSCNYVTDVAAKLGREEKWACKDWTANFPGEIVRSLSKDLGIHSID